MNEGQRVDQRPLEAKLGGRGELMASKWLDGKQVTLQGLRYRLRFWRKQKYGISFFSLLWTHSGLAQMVNNLPANAEDPGSGDPGNGNPLQHSCLENSMDRGAWQLTDHRVAKTCCGPGLGRQTGSTPKAYLDIQIPSLALPCHSLGCCHPSEPTFQPKAVGREKERASNILIQKML